MVKKNRLYLKERLISLVSLCKKCNASKLWLGNYSPVKKIKESDLWLVQGLYKESLTEKEFEKIIKKQ